MQINAAPPARWGSALARWTGSAAHCDELIALGREIGLGDPYDRDFATEESPMPRSASPSSRPNCA
ncbi:MAG: hypothetical protein U0232_16565 [Thermomicrobiales bacterium]